MIFKLNVFLLIFGGLAWLPAPVRLAAQQLDGENIAEFTFTTALVSRSPGQLFYRPDAEEDLVPVKFNRIYRSELYTYKGPIPLRFYRESGRDDQGNPQYEVVASVSGMTGGSRWLLLFDRPRGSESWRVDVIPDDIINLPVNTLAVYNTTSEPLAAMVGDRVIPLPVGMSRPVDISRFQEQHKILQTTVEVSDMVYETREVETVNRAVTLIVVYQTPEQVHRLYESSQMVSPGHRYLMLFLPPIAEGSTRFRSKMLSERVEEPQP
ncbi:MAG: hypothetical protein JJU05_04315 [Verrucomicrobia bacterium]|nr:hypothetical protein [Verrucomicrobiota bacterium]MCH8525556.1 hypothetical protein [Kiritimatiellia bacterium]